MKGPANGPQTRMGLDFTLKLVPFVDPTDARCARLKGVICVRPRACRVGPKCRPAKPGQTDGLESVEFFTCSRNDRVDCFADPAVTPKPLLGRPEACCRAIQWP